MEDPFLWYDAPRKKFCLIAKDDCKNGSSGITGEWGGGFYAESDDCIHFELAEDSKVYSRTVNWKDGHISKQGNLERPCLLFDENGTPTHLFCTTGPAKRVFYTEADTEHTIGFFAAGISEMLAPGQKCFIAFPFTGPFGLGDLIAAAVERLDGIPIKAGFGQTWQEMLALLEETQPETYIGFPVTLLSLSRLYGKHFPVKRALVSGDACPKGVMAELERDLDSKLYPHYGSRECGLGGAVTCSAHEGMHLRENHIIAEIIDENGNVLPDGEYGRF